ncbi:hypothetical protein [Streptomyces sp. NPDC053541]|uniref:hypothetical protein n=1 Tax=Streptomyces sp. NPDC053541 TaxID=3365709 RepID=UPI0037D4B8C0
MATSGSSGTRRSRASALLLAGALLAGCSPGAGRGDGPPPDRPADRPAPRAAVRAAAACEVPLPESWQRAFAAGEYRAPAGQRAVLVDTGPGWTALQLTGGGTGSGGGRRAALVPGRGGAPRTLLRFADPVEHQLLAADHDGRRWAAFAVLEGRTLDSPWSLYVWDAATGRTRRLARADRPGPLPRPVVRDGTVVWAQGTGGGRATVFAAPAAGGPTRAWRTAVLDTPFAAGGLLVWREAAGGHTRPVAVALTDGRPAALPAPIAALRDVRALVSDGTTWAWVAGETAPRLMVWRPGEARPFAAVTASPAVDGMDQLRIAGRLVTWRTPETSYALDLGSPGGPAADAGSGPGSGSGPGQGSGSGPGQGSGSVLGSSPASGSGSASGSYARITPPYGYAAASGNALALAYSVGNAKTPGARPVIRVVDAARLPALPPCG